MPGPDPQARRRNLSSRKRGRALIWFERACLLAGCALLSAFAWGKVEQGVDSQSAIQSFRAVSGGAPVAAPATRAASPAADSEFRVARPDQSQWSEKRIAEYELSLRRDENALPLAILRAPRLGLEAPVYNGADDFNLNRGVGRIPGTARVDQPGNLGIAGHRDGFFRALQDAREEDLLELETLNGVLKYRVGSIRIVDPEDVSVLAPTSENTITLVTCYPFYFVGEAPKRYIVTATAESPTTFH